MLSHDATGSADEKACIKAGFQHDTEQARVLSSAHIAPVHPATRSKPFLLGSFNLCSLGFMPSDDTPPGGDYAAHYTGASP